MTARVEGQTPTVGYGARRPSPCSKTSTFQIIPHRQMCRVVMLYEPRKKDREYDAQRP